MLFVNIQIELGVDADLVKSNSNNRIDILPAFYFGMDQTLASDHIHDRLQIIFKPTDDPQHCSYSHFRWCEFHCCLAPVRQAQSDSEDPKSCLLRLGIRD